MYILYSKQINNLSKYFSQQSMTIYKILYMKYQVNII